MRAVLLCCCAVAAWGSAEPKCPLVPVLQLGQLDRHGEVGDTDFGGGLVLEMQVTVEAKPGSTGSMLFESTSGMAVYVREDLGVTATVTKMDETFQFGSGMETLQLKTLANVTVVVVPESAGSERGECYFYLNGAAGDQIPCGVLAREVRSTYIGTDSAGSRKLSGVVNSVDLKACHGALPPSPDTIAAPECALVPVLQESEVDSPGKVGDLNYGGGFVLEMDVTVAEAPPQSSKLLESVSADSQTKVVVSVSKDLVVSTSIEGQPGKVVEFGTATLQLNTSTKVTVTAVPEAEEATEGTCYLYLDGVESGRHACEMVARESRETYVGLNITDADVLPGVVHSLNLSACSGAAPTPSPRTIFRPECALQRVLELGEVDHPSKLSNADFGGGFVLEVEVTMKKAPERGGWPSTLVEWWAKKSETEVELYVNDELSVIAEIATNKDTAAAVFVASEAKALELNKKTVVTVTAVPDGPGSTTGICHLYIDGLERGWKPCEMLKEEARHTYVERDHTTLEDLSGVIHRVHLTACTVGTPAPPTPAPAPTPSPSTMAPPSPPGTGTPAWVWVVVGLSVVVVAVGVGAGVWLYRKRSSAAADDYHQELM